MIDWTPLLNITIVFMAGAISPGPNFLVVAHRALVHGRAEGLATVIGVALVSTMWAAASLFGLAIVFKLFPWMHVALRLGGAAYLIWLGIKLWLAASRPAREASTEGDKRKGLADAFRAGLATNLSNVRAIAFYASTFSAVAPSPDETATLWAALLLVLLLVILWYGFVALLLSTGPLARAYRRGRQWIERGSGLLMIYFGLQLAWFE